MLILYADVLFAINFSMDFLALFITSRLFYRKISKIRIIIASALGAIFGVIEVIVVTNDVVSFVFSIIVAMVIIKICFDDKVVKNYIIMVVLFVFVCAILGGVMSVLYTIFNRVISEIIKEQSFESTYTNARTVIIIGLTSLAAIIFVRIFKEKRSVKSVLAKIKVREREYEVSCLCDTGNLLREPFSGRSVMLVSAATPIGKEIESIEDIYKRYIPFKDINGEGILKGIIPKKIVINNVSVDAVIAAVENSDFGGCDALISSELA